MNMIVMYVSDHTTIISMGNYLISLLKGNIITYLYYVQFFSKQFSTCFTFYCVIAFYMTYMCAKFRIQSFLKISRFGGHIHQ